LLYFAPNKLLVQGSHLIWLASPKASSSWLIRLVLGLNSKKYKVSCFAGKSMLPLWSPELYQQGLDQITKKWEWNYITDLHLGLNEWVQRDLVLTDYANIKLGNTVIELQEEDKTG